MAHLEPEEPETKFPTDKARAGETGHNVRYVPAFGLTGIFVAFAALLFIYNWQWNKTGRGSLHFKQLDGSPWNTRNLPIAFSWQWPC